MYGFLGPNGAGKTTTIRHLMGFLNPDAGRCSIAGLDCRARQAEIQKNLGYLPGEIAFFDEMKGTEFLRFKSRMRGQRYQPRMAELLERFQMDPSGRIKKMSKGMKQKLGLVAALMHDPEILILDEPTSGLDPLMQAAFIDLIRDEKRRGKTVLMSSHSFEEVEKTADRVGIIRQGRLAATLGADEMKRLHRRVFSLSFPSRADADAFAGDDLEIVLRSENRVHVAVTGDLKPFTRALSLHPVTDLDVVTQSLEDLFISFYGGDRA